MLAKSIALHFGYNKDTVFDPNEVVEAGYRTAPRIAFTHAGSAQPSREAWAVRKRIRQYKAKKVIFLARDPRDILVSHFFEKTRREGESHRIKDFVRHPDWGIDQIIEFMNDWYGHRHLPLAFRMVRYEDLRRNPRDELRNILGFLSIFKVSSSIINEAVEYSSFENMRGLSIKELNNEPRLAPTDPSDPESFKVRRGKVGGYKDYLSDPDIEYVNNQLSAHLSQGFAYTADHE